MVKGLSRRVIVVDSPDPHIFEQAIFIAQRRGSGQRRGHLPAGGGPGHPHCQGLCPVPRRAAPAAAAHVPVAGGPSGRRGHRRGVAFGHADLIPLLFSYHFSPHLGADGVSRSALPFCPGAVSYGWEAGKPALPSADRKAPCGKCRISFISIIMYEAGNPLSKFSQFPVANFFCV